MVSHDSSLFNYLSFYTHRISITGEEHELDAASLGLYVHVYFWESATSPKTCLRASPKMLKCTASLWYQQDFSICFLSMCRENIIQKHHTDFFCQVNSQLHFAYKLIEAIPFQARLHTNLCWVLLHPIKANWLLKVFFLSVAEIRSEQTRLCTRGPHDPLHYCSIYCIRLPTAALAQFVLKFLCLRIG